MRSLDQCCQPLGLDPARRGSGGCQRTVSYGSPKTIGKHSDVTIQKGAKISYEVVTKITSWSGGSARQEELTPSEGRGVRERTADLDAGCRARRPEFSAFVRGRRPPTARGAEGRGFVSQVREPRLLSLARKRAWGNPGEAVRAPGEPQALAPAPARQAVSTAPPGRPAPPTAAQSLTLAAGRSARS
ncbi:hypothetical protein NN561_009583 [Cricetulus griseus]